MKALKWVLWIAGGLVALAVIAIAIVAATFDPNQYKPQIVDLVKEKTGRTLTMDGKIGLTFFPKVGAEMEKVALSERNGPKPFARIEEARVALALLPLLSKQVIVDQVTLSGLNVDLVRYKDGRTNFDDLVGEKKPGEPAPKAEAPGGPAPMIDIGGIALKNANIGWRDEGDGTDVRLSNVNLKTGRIASSVPGKLDFQAKIDGRQPRAALQVDLDTGYKLDFDTKALALSSLDLKANGDAPGVAGLDARLKGSTVDYDPKAGRIDLAGIELAAKSKDGLDAKFSIPKLRLAPDRAESQAIAGEVKLAQPKQSIDAKIALSALEAKGKEIQFSRLDVDLDAKLAELAVQGKIGTPVTLSLEAQEARLPGIAGDLAISGPNIPGKSVKAALKGGARADWGKRNANAELALKLDDSNVQARVAVANWAQPAINFDVAADRLNLDRYFPPEKPPAAPASGGGPKGGAAQTAAASAPDKPIDLSGLKTLNASGNVKVGALQMHDVKAEAVSAAVKAAGGRLDVAPISASLYQGALAGSAHVDANANAFAVKQTLTNVSIGPLLRDAAQKDVLEGRGNVALDVRSAGTTMAALKNALAGNASLALRDGAVKGVDIAGTIRKAKALLGSKGALEEQAKGGDKTDFTELSASFVIKNGIAHNDDLKGASPLLRLAGAGDIDIGNDRIDYLVRASVVATASGQGGKDLAQVAGVTVPVKITGPFDALRYSVDVGALATEAAKDALTRELDRRLGGSKAGQPGGSSGVEDALRGLFGRKK